MTPNLIGTAPSQASRLRADTAVKRSGISLFSALRQMQAADVQKSVLNELGNNSYRANTKNFLGAILPVQDELVTKVFEKLCERPFDNQGSPLYNQDKQMWRDIPLVLSQESSLYSLFVNCSNGIIKACSQLKIDFGIDSVYWRDYSTFSPSSRDWTAAKLRPDVVAGLHSESVVDAARKLDQDIHNLEKLFDNKEEEGEKGCKVRLVIVISLVWQLTML